jgi:putative NIF3 family GTP cyclohydrolase 1 type 2
MPITRRSVLVAGAALVAAASARAARQQAGAPITAAEVIDRIKSKVGMPWLAKTVDAIVAGTPDIRVQGIATTMMATLDVVQRAAAAGRNMVITHEPTFYSHFDTTEELRNDPTFERKRNFIAKHEMVVFRFHDHWHLMKPDGIATGMARELGWDKFADPDEALQFVFRATRLDQFAAAMSTRLNARSMRIVGDPKLQVRRVAASWGYVSLWPEFIKVASRPDVDLIVIGETREWELVEYVQDQIAAGAPKALIVLNHVVSEQAGMKYCAEWLTPIVPELPVEFIAAQEPFWRPGGSR